MPSLIIKNLHVEVNGTPILKGLDLAINEGETVALLGPNGHGKSTLLAAIMGNPNFVVTDGEISFDGRDVLSMSVDERSKAGLFLAMQYPAEIPGLNSADFYKAAINARRDAPLGVFAFYQILEKAYRELGIPFEMSKRNLNEGFSGGEKKRNEILQMRLLAPKIAMLDEIDSGLDVDAMNVVAEAIEKEKERGAGFLIISHYARLYHMVKPTRAAILVNGRIVLEGGPEIIERIDKEGYAWLKGEYGVSIDKENAVPTSIGSCATKVKAIDGK